ncbi:MAG: methyltransferase [Sneathiella sp.]|nr:methyltransferase [Sneathiella sp.]
MEWTTDGFLGGKLKIKQPKKGFRAGSDAVLLASIVEASKGAPSVLDVGCGVGTVGLCIKSRIPEARVYGLEVQSLLAAQARENAKVNNLEKGFSIFDADICDRSAFADYLGPTGRAFLNDAFDFVLTNPPFYEEGRAQSSPDEIKAKAHIETGLDLAEWLKFSVARIKPRGMIAVIHRADRLADILNAISKNCGRINIIPLWPNAQTAAKRVIVTAVKNDRSGNMLSPGLVMHNLDGSPTEVSEKLLRDGLGYQDIFN